MVPDHLIAESWQLPAIRIDAYHVNIIGFLVQVTVILQIAMYFQCWNFSHFTDRPWPKCFGPIHSAEMCLNQTSSPGRSALADINYYWQLQWLVTRFCQKWSQDSQPFAATGKKDGKYAHSPQGWPLQIHDGQIVFSTANFQAQQGQLKTEKASSINLGQFTGVFFSNFRHWQSFLFKLFYMDI